MAEHIGIVIKTEPNGYARVVADRKSACGGCQSTPGGCRSCLATAKMESRVFNPVRAGTGDLVKVHLASSSLIKGAFILYLLPVCGLMAGSFGGVLAAARFGGPEVPFAIAGAVIGLAAGFAAVAGLDRSQYIRRRVTPNIIAIVSKNVGMPEAGRAACCPSTETFVSDYEKSKPG